jgi:hypothetical protein
MHVWRRCASSGWEWWFVSAFVWVGPPIEVDAGINSGWIVGILKTLLMLITKNGIDKKVPICFSSLGLANLSRSSYSEADGSLKRRLG